jgi:hypothetical protein
MLPAYTLDRGPWSMVNFDCLTPLEEQPALPNILALTTALVQRWPMTNLLDILKETELRVRFTEAFRTTCARRCFSWLSPFSVFRLQTPGQRPGGPKAISYQSVGRQFL